MMSCWGIYLLIFASGSKTRTMSKKGSTKNTKNKAKHSKLMAQKKNKLKKNTELRKTRLKEINANIKSNDDSITNS